MRDVLAGGVDGGQSSTAAAIGDGRGRVLGRATGPPADLVGEPAGSGRQRDAIETALGAALLAAGLPAATRLDALVVGLTGHDAGMPAPFAIAHDRVRFVHDTESAHAGALGGAAGIVVLAGTGSVALGNASPDSFVRAGGWGYFFGDEGGALWIARRAIAEAMRAHDRGSESPFGEAARAFFGLADLRALQHAFARGEVGRPALAAFALPVLALEADESRNLQDAAAFALVDLAAAVEARLPPPARGTSRAVSYAGGVFGNPGVLGAFARGLRERIPQAELRPPLATPLDGALVLARKLAAGEAESPAPVSHVRVAPERAVS